MSTLSWAENNKKYLGFHQQQSLILQMNQGVPSMNVYNIQQRPTNVQPYAKLMRDCITQEQVHKSSKKVLQKIAIDLNIPIKMKKDELIQRLPEELLKLIQNDLMIQRPAEQIAMQYKVFRENQDLCRVLKAFIEQVQKAAPFRQQMPQMPVYMYNPMNPLQIQPHMMQMFLSGQQQRMMNAQPQYWMNEISQQQPTQPQQQQYIPVQKDLNALCPCKIVPSRRLENSQELKCLSCQCKYHASCLKATEGKNFECPGCTLAKMDPVCNVIKTLSAPTLMQNYSVNLNFILNIEETQKLMTDKTLQVEIRAIRMDLKYIYETTWPDWCEISVNQQKLQNEFKPLKSNSSLKKRKDEPVIIPFASIQKGMVQVQIKDTGMQTSEPKAQFKITDDAIYCFAIFLTKKRQSMDLINSIKNDANCLLNRDKCVELIHTQNQLSECDIEIDKIANVKVSLKCQLDLMMIKTPARGRFCLHAQCFSLENVITLMAQCSPRKWKCPICKQRIFDMVIDQLQLDLLDSYRRQNKHVKEVFFDQDAEVVNEVLDDIYSDDEDIQPQSEKKVEPEIAAPINILQFQQQLAQLQQQPILKQFYDKQQQYLMNHPLQLGQLNQHLLTQARQYQQALLQQKKNQEPQVQVVVIHQNRKQLVQLINSSKATLPEKISDLQQSFNTKSMFRSWKIVKYEQWSPEQQIPQQEDKNTAKTQKIKEKLVKVIKKQYYDQMRKIFGTMDNPKQVPQPLAPQRKTTYKLSDIETELTEPPTKVNNPPQQEIQPIVQQPKPEEMKQPLHFKKVKTQIPKSGIQQDDPICID